LERNERLLPIVKRFFIPIRMKAQKNTSNKIAYLPNERDVSLSG